MRRQFKIQTSVDLNQFAGLEYLTVSVPTFRIEGDDTPVGYPELQVCNKVAKIIIRKKVPIRGLELKFFRCNVLKITLQELARSLDISSVAIHKWEKAKTKRLHRINEAAVLLFMSEQLGLRYKIQFSDLCIKTDTSRTSTVRVIVKNEI